MRLVLCLLLTLVIVLPLGTVWAAPIDDAAAANARGDYAAELRITRPLAAKGVAWAHAGSNRRQRQHGMAPQAALLASMNGVGITEAQQIAIGFMPLQPRPND